MHCSHCRHRSHFGSRYKLGCCSNAGLFFTCSPCFMYRLHRLIIEKKHIMSLVLLLKCMHRKIIVLSVIRKTRISYRLHLAHLISHLALLEAFCNPRNCCVTSIVLCSFDLLNFVAWYLAGQIFSITPPRICLTLLSLILNDACRSIGLLQN